MTTFTTKLSGYLAAATEVTWASGQTLASLLDNEYTDLSDEIDNSTTKYQYADLFIKLASAAFTGTDSGIDCYLIPCINGTDYPTWTGNGTTDEQENNAKYVGFVATTGTTAAQQDAVLRVPLPNAKFKFAFRNKSNVGLAASGNSVEWRPHGFIATDV